MTWVMHRQPPLPKRITIIGVGLIGGSFALALRRAVPEVRITGVDRDQVNLAAARQLGVLDVACNDIASAVEDAQLVMLSVPVGACEQALRELGPVLPEQAVLTDVGSTKNSVWRAAQRALPHGLERFIPGHPIAGSEHSGVRAARGDLFNGRSVVLAPQAECDERARCMVQRCWEACGATVEFMTLECHDGIFGAVSHLPHLLSFALVYDVATRADSDTLLRFAASGFRDFTRIAASSPEMWRDISFANRDILLQELEQYRSHLDNLTRLLENNDQEALEALFRVARQVRRSWAPSS